MVEIERKTESGLGMYTQCPDCEIAFRVTAEVLKQAAGKVRCGSCGNAFNALAYLSEQMPKQPAPQDENAALPELKPEIIETDSGKPQTISAEQSAALLKTLDELAGSDIRIEDTGVEWRVLDENEAAAPAADDDDAGIVIGATNVDEYLDATQTPIDEFLTATPEVVDSPEIFEDIDVVAGKTSVDELRFDDNTPLPDDFDIDDESELSAFVDLAPAMATEEDPEPDAVAEPAPDFALSEPDEWTDILGEFEELVEEASAPTEALVEDQNDDAEESVEAADPVLLADDHKIDKPLDMDTQFALQAEAMGIDLSGINEVELNDNELVDELDELVDELVQEPEQDADQETHDEPAAELVEEIDDEPEAEFGEELDDDDAPEAEIHAEFDEEPEAEIDVELDEEPEADWGDELDEDVDVEPEIEPESDTDEEDESLELDLELLDLMDELPELLEEPVLEAYTIEAELAEDIEALSDDEIADADEDSGEHYVPPMTEEEHTVNMQIDQDLMALAIEDDDGFASTIVIPDRNAEKKALEETTREIEDETDDPEENDLFETIIMEGEFVRSEVDAEKLAADSAEAAKLAEAARAAEAEKARHSGNSRYGIIGGIVLLVIVFAVQLMHQSREALATMPAFSNTIGQVYRAIGQPVQPAWDITGWRIEASNDTIQVEEGEENLTVYSRIGNNSKGSLPYPLVSISLTDRFLETLGNQVLDPAEYLPTDLDPRKLVEPGNTFNAVILIKSPPVEASGYKVDVCYRMTDGKLRCKANDFK